MAGGLAGWGSRSRSRPGRGSPERVPHQAGFERLRAASSSLAAQRTPPEKVRNCLQPRKRCGRPPPRHMSSAPRVSPPCHSTPRAAEERSHENRIFVRGTRAHNRGPRESDSHPPCTQVLVPCRRRRAARRRAGTTSSRRRTCAAQRSGDEPRARCAPAGMHAHSSWGGRWRSSLAPAPSRSSLIAARPSASRRAGRCSPCP